MKKLIVAFGLSTLLIVTAPFTVTAGSLTLRPSKFTFASQTVTLADANAFARANFNWLGSTNSGIAVFES